MKMTPNHKWALYFFLVVYTEETFGIESFCIADPVSVGDNASVSCHFTEDLSIAQRDVNVLMYKLYNENEPVLVFFYSWINGTSSIKVVPGYDCRSKLTDHLEIAIYNVTKEHAGIYKCIISPSEKHQSYPCTLHVNEDSQLDFEVANNNPTTIDTGYKDVYLSSSRPAFDENNGKQDDDIETKSETTGHIVAIICSVITVVLVVILLLILVTYRTRWICKSQRSTPDSDNVDMEQRVALNNPENTDLVNSLRQEQGTAPENKT